MYGWGVLHISNAADVMGTRVVESSSGIKMEHNWKNEATTDAGGQSGGKGQANFHERLRLERVTRE